MNNDIFISLQSLASKRWAVLEDDGVSAWLYLTEPNSEKPIADCWIYNRVRVSSKEDMAKYSIPYPAICSVTDDNAVYDDVDQSILSFLWSKNGESVCLFYGNICLGYICENDKLGYSFHLTNKSTWGNVFDLALFKKTFLDL